MRTVLSWGPWVPLVAPAGDPGPSCFATCSSDLGAEIGEGLLEAGTPQAPTPAAR